MIARFGQSLVVIGSLTLALPTGWCAMVLGHFGAEEGAGCCQRDVEESGSDDASAPQEARVDCCCQRDAIPARNLALADAILPACWGGTAVVTEAAGSVEYRSAPRLPGSSVPARVLQCVWIC